MTEVLLDQLPMLSPMLRGLEEMNMMQDPGNVTTQNAFIVQTMPEIRERIMKGKNWPEICKYQLENQFSDDGKGAKKDMERMMSLYTSEVFEDFMEDPKC